LTNPLTKGERERKEREMRGPDSEAEDGGVWYIHTFNKLPRS
jgi:hypothetical protein